MGAHALGAAAYAVKAVSLASPGQPHVADDEIIWQLQQVTAEMRPVLRTLPAVGEDRSGPLGPGLLASGQMKRIIQQLQAGLG